MDTSFDFIIVGGGTAGCLIASRLANTPSRPSVLLLETGEDNNKAKYRQTYDKFSLAFTTPTLDHEYTSTPQYALDGRQVGQLRGKGLGGSSQTNFMLWSLGARDEFDHWASVVDDDSWGFDSVVRHIRKFEHLHLESPQIGSVEFANPDPGYRGYNGEVDVSIGPHYESEIQHIMAAAIEFGSTVNHDVNSGDPIGFGLPPHSSWKGKRTTSASAFLSPEQRPSNLAVVTGCRVTRLLFEGSRVSGVQAEHGRYFRGGNEVILTAGAIDTPRLLLLSGVGPAQDLEDLGIPVVEDLPAVGRSLADHPNAFLTFEMRAGFSGRHHFDGNTAAMEAAVEQFGRDGTGLLTVHYGSVPVAFFKLDSIEKRPSFSTLTSEMQHLLLQPTVPHYEFAMCGPLLPFGSLAHGAEEGYFNFFVALQNAQARGTVTLSSSDHRQPPLIDPNYMGRTYDEDVMSEGIAAALAYMSTPTMQRYLARPIHASRSSSTKDIKAFLKANVAGLWHPSGTMKMGLKHDPTTAVNADLLVHGFSNMRVADMSVTPNLPSGHTHIVAYVIGAVAAEKIIKQHRLYRGIAAA